MKTPISHFWGKAESDEEGNVISWHPLKDHCLDVAACLKSLLKIDVIRNRLASSAGLDDLSETICDRLVFISALHDIGKFNIGFQSKLIETGFSSAGHVNEVAQLLAERSLSKNLQDLLCPLSNWASPEIFHSLLFASWSHHGKPVQSVTQSQVNLRLWKEWEKLRPFEGMRELVDEISKELPAAFKSNEKIRPQSMSTITKLQQV